MSATGTGQTLAEAITTFLGEAADLLSQFERHGDVTAPGLVSNTVADTFSDGWIGAALSSSPSSRLTDWIIGKTLPGHLMIRLPADLCLRRAPAVRAIQPIGALSSGCAAGPTTESATERAILELVERDAAALWWYGGRNPRAIDQTSQLDEVGRDLLAALRQGSSHRITHFLEITTELGVPAFASISTDLSGFGFACGLGCRRDSKEALGAAIREMCQMELSAPLSAIKLNARGPEALTIADRRHLKRAAFDTKTCKFFQPATPDNPLRVRETISDFEVLLRILQKKQIRVAVTDLTRDDIGIRVVRAMSPDLQPFDTTIKTKRLLKEIDTSGGGEAHTTGVPLM